MTRLEAAIISVHTGVLVGEFDYMKRYIENKLKRTVFTHEMNSKKFRKMIKAACFTDFKCLFINDYE